MAKKKDVVAPEEGINETGDMLNSDIEADNDASDVSDIVITEEDDTDSEALCVSSSTVLVASNFPHALKFKVTQNGGISRTIVIRGNAEKLKGREKGVLPVGAYGVTLIKADEWECIKKNYKEFPPIKNGLVFAAKNDRDIKKATKERAALRHGFEPINTSKTAHTRPNK